MSTTYAAAAANGMALMARSRAVFGPCSQLAFWSPISLGTTVDHKHGQPRWIEESP
ncbi:MAG: hypothetical protein ACT4OX_16865 [Actinomycetota bacterium]